MASKKFIITIVILSVCSSFAGIIFIWSLKQDHLAVAKFSIALLWLIILLIMISYLNRTNRSIRLMLDNLLSPEIQGTGTDTSFSVNERLGSTYNRIADTIRELRAKQEEELQYASALASNAGTGIIAYSSTGNIRTYNRAACEILNNENPVHITSLNKSAEGLADFISELEAGRSGLFKTIISNQFQSLIIKKSEFRTRHNSYTVVSVQNIHAALEAKELETWQKLINVLTHEIMNSVSPIKSLSYTLTRKAGNLADNAKELKKEHSSIYEGLKAIGSRSQDLLKFVESYRELCALPRPDYQPINVNSLLSEIKNLYRTEMEEKNIRLSFSKNRDLPDMYADRNLISQMIINLISNSVHILEKTKNGKIDIKAYQDSGGHHIIEVSDNGPGIDPLIADRIFIPFFTTRKGGSGIGLSIVKQIMTLHNGTVSVLDRGHGATFVLTFN